MKIIAEIGINHGGNIVLAEEMIRKAAKCGADIAKFQKYDPIKILGSNNPNLKEAMKCQLTKSEHEYLWKKCHEANIDWMVSIFHPEDIDWTESLGMRAYKIASRSALDNELLGEINITRKPVYLSAGLINYDDIPSRLKLLKDCSVTLLYCVSKYPTTADDIDLKKINELKKYGPFGFSSHCPDWGKTFDIIQMGAEIVEHHVKLSKSATGCDMSSSITFKQLGKLISRVGIKNEKYPEIKIRND